ncbi:hypothetical protein ACIBTP_24975 [Streptomyces avidinii]|uniref:hypothetical protein n=1 Tax=Streptomyces avidinii TaxID=1895 RepID=UPI0037B5BAFC
MLLLAALAGAFLRINGVLIGTMLTLSVALLIVAVLAPRMEGPQKVKGIGEFNLCDVEKTLQKREHEISLGHLVSLEAVNVRMAPPTDPRNPDD